MHSLTRILSLWAEPWQKAQAGHDHRVRPVGVEGSVMTVWRPIERAPRDGTMFLALDLGLYPAFVRYQRPYKGKYKRWFIVASQGAVFSVNDLAERQMTKWRPLPHWNEDRTAPAKEIV